MAAVEAQVRQLRADMDRHEDADDRRFDQLRADSEERGRRLFERIEKSENILRTLVEDRMGSLGMKVDQGITTLVAKTNELEMKRQEADLAKARADGIAEGRRPGPTRLAVIQGMAGEALKLVATVLAAVSMLAFTGWSIQHRAPAAPVVSGK